MNIQLSPDGHRCVEKPSSSWGVGVGRTTQKKHEKPSSKLTRSQELFLVLLARLENQILCGRPRERVLRGTCLSGGVKLAEDELRQKLK